MLPLPRPLPSLPPPFPSFLPSATESDGQARSVTKVGSDTNNYFSVF